jgi:hypothetical protein
VLDTLTRHYALETGQNSPPVVTAVFRIARDSGAMDYSRHTDFHLGLSFTDHLRLDAILGNDLGEPIQWR